MLPGKTYKTSMAASMKTIYIIENLTLQKAYLFFVLTTQ